MIIKYSEGQMGQIVEADEKSREEMDELLRRQSSLEKDEDDKKPSWLKK